MKINKYEGGKNEQSSLSKVSCSNEDRSLQTAVLFLVFNRLDTTKEVFQEIKIAKPPRLYIAADGPRKNREEDLKKVEEVRNYIFANVDWCCEVKTLFNKDNLGCKYSISSAISWFFETEDQGIILEDDVVPNQDFFYFVESCLNKYHNDSRVMMVTGTNYIGNDCQNEPYFFSEHISIWGWGTWRSAWELYDVEMSSWKCDKVRSYFKEKYNSTYIWKYFRNIFDALVNKEVDSWAIQWVFACLYNHGLCITPKVNLITNIGVVGAHSEEVSESHFIRREKLNYIEYDDFFPTVKVNYLYDLKLHSLKTRRVMLRNKMVLILKVFRLYSFLRSIKRFFCSIKK